MLGRACLPAGAAEGGGAPPPNILFLAVDDLRPSIGAYGDRLAVTPHLDRLAASGTLFERAYCQQAVCSPSRTSLLTGVRPDTTGIYDLATHFRSRLPELVTLPEHFRKHGYRVIGRGKIYHSLALDDPASWDSPPAEGRSLAGTVYALPENRAEPPADGAGGEKVRVRRPAFERAEVPDTAYGDGILAEEAAGLLGELKREGKPFFLAIGFLKPHLPFNAPSSYWELHDREKLWPPPNLRIPEGVPAWVSQPGWELRNAYAVPSDYAVPLDLELQKTLRHGYYAATSYVDAQIGKVLAALDREGLAQNTIVVLWGDHGYLAGDHGTWCKHTNFELAVHAPLLLRVPGQRPGLRVGATVEFLDIYPTLAALAGLPIPAHVEGRSLAPYLADPSRPADKPAFSQYPRGAVKTGNPMMGYSVRTARWRYTEWIRTDTGAAAFRELYDLDADPHCTRSVAEDPAHGETVAELSRLLEGAGKGVAEARRQR